MNEEDLGICRLVRAAFQYNSTVTDLEFLKFWESLSVRDRFSYWELALRMGFLSWDGLIFIGARAIRS